MPEIELGLLFFKTMQLANFGIGAMLLVEALPRMFVRQKDGHIKISSFEFNAAAVVLAITPILAFWRRLADKMVVWFGYDIHNSAMSVVAMFTFYITIWWFLRHVRQELKTTALLAGIILFGSFGLTVLESFQ